MPQEITDVLFRVSKDDPSDVFALFPGLPGTSELSSCMCYQHIGQHSTANLHMCIRESRRAKKGEYASLASELEGRGYTLRVVSRSTREHARQRREALEAMSA